MCSILVGNEKAADKAGGEKFVKISDEETPVIFGVIYRRVFSRSRYHASDRFSEHGGIIDVDFMTDSIVDGTKISTLK